MLTLAFKRILSHSLLLLACSLSFAARSFASDFFVALDGQNKKLSINRVFLKDLYLGLNTYSATAGEVTAAFYLQEAQHLEDIVPNLTELSFKRYNSIWRRKLFSGSAIPPIKLKNQVELEQFLASNANFVIVTDQDKLPLERLKTISWEKVPEQ